MEPVTLQTPRLTLSIPTVDDIAAIVAGAQDPAVPQWTTVPSPYSEADGRKFIEIAAAGWDAGGNLNWCIRADSGFVGMIGLHHAESGSAEIGYWLAASARGLGYVAEAAHAVIAFAFGPPLALKRVEWRAGVGNTASARVARGLGFQYEGLLRQALVSPRGRSDGWIAGLLVSDDRTPKVWPI